MTYLNITLGLFRNQKDNNKKGKSFIKKAKLKNCINPLMHSILEEQI